MKIEESQTKETNKRLFDLFKERQMKRKQTIYA